MPLVRDFGAVGRGLSVAERRRFVPPAAGVPERLLPEPPVEGASLPLDVPKPLREITGIRNSLTDDWRVAKDAGRWNEARIIQEYIDALDSYVDDIMPDALRERWEAARLARKEQADRFERPQTAIAQTLARREGQYARPNSDVVEDFIPSNEGNLTDFQAFTREVGQNSRAREAVRDQILADVERQKLLGKPEALDAYLDQYSQVFREFPGLKQELTQAGTAQRGVEAAKTAESAVLATLGPQGKGSVAKYLKFGDERAEDAMRQVMRSPHPGQTADELLRFVNDAPQAVGGARKAFWEIMSKSARRKGETTADFSGTQPWMPRALKGFLDNPAANAVAERLYRDNPEHLQNLKTIAEALQKVDLRLRARAPNTSGTGQIVNSGLSVPTLQSCLFAVRRGQIGVPYLVTHLLVSLFNRARNSAMTKAAERLLDDALLDPDLAARLLKENNPANRAALRRHAKNWTVNEANTLLEMMTPRDGEDDIRDAVTRK